MILSIFIDDMNAVHSVELETTVKRFCCKLKFKKTIYKLNFLMEINKVARS